MLGVCIVTQELPGQEVWMCCMKDFCCTDKSCDRYIISYFRLYMGSEAGEPRIFVA
jgi:hypothetical protein